MTNDCGNPKDKNTAEHRDFTRADRCIAACTGANRGRLEKLLKERRNRLLTTSTNATWAECIRRADEWARGRFLGDLAADDWSEFVSDMHARYAPSTVYTIAGFVKATLPAMQGVDEVPKAIRRALSVREPSRRPDGRIITEDQFTALLEAAARFPLHGYNALQRLQIVTMLHVVRDSGFRASELLALRLGSVEFSGEHAAYLCLPKDRSVTRLKTGPRDVAVARCVPALKAWMQAHPAAGDDHAPLFPRVRDRRGREAMQYVHLQRVVQKLGELIRIEETGDRSKGLSCHDFRHTRATEASKANWHPTKMEAYFGWSPGSKMAARYSHLARSDLRDQVLRDAGLQITAQPEPVQEVKNDAADKLAAVFRELIQDR